MNPTQRYVIAILVLGALFSPLLFVSSPHLNLAVGKAIEAVRSQVTIDPGLVVLRNSFNGNTTLFLYFNDSQLTQMTDVTIEHIPYGRIMWQGPVNLTMDAIGSYIDLDAAVFINNNLVGVDPTRMTSLDTFATITIYGLSLTNPRILRDGSPCPSSICTFVAYTGGNLTFHVTGFSNYSVEETPTIPTSGGGGGSGRQYAPEPAAPSATLPMPPSTPATLPPSTQPEKPTIEKPQQVTIKPINNIELTLACGNGYCGIGETARICPQDCARIITRENVDIYLPYIEAILFAMTLVLILFGPFGRIARRQTPHTKLTMALITLLLLQSALGIIDGLFFKTTTLFLGTAMLLQVGVIAALWIHGSRVLKKHRKHNGKHDEAGGQHRKDHDKKGPEQKETEEDPDADKEDGEGDNGTED
jgi:hypothetical protein